MKHYKTDVIALKKIMIDEGVDSVSELARISGGNRTTLGRILKGEEQPSADLMGKLAYSLHMSPATAGGVFFALELTRGER